MKSVFLAVLAVATLGFVTADNCYECSNDEIGIQSYLPDSIKNNTKCLDQFESLDNNATCTMHHVCFKRLIVKGDKTFIERGCLNKTEVGDFTFDDTVTDECGSASMFGSDWSMCFCNGDKCNGGGTVVATITLTVLSALASKLAY